MFKTEPGLKEASDEPIYMKPDGSVMFNGVDYVCMMADPLSAGYDKSTKVRLKKLDSLYDYNPNDGYLLSNVKMSYYPKKSIMNIVADKYEVIAPKRITDEYGYICKKDYDKIKVNPDDVVFKLGKFYIVKYRFYYTENVYKLKRCYIGTPIEIIDCVIPDNTING